MPTSSGWPLKPGAIRFFVPLFASTQLARHPLTESLYINGMGLYPCASGHYMQRNEHEDNLLMYCSSGSGFLQVAGERQPVNPGHLIILPKDTPHEYGSNEKTPWTLRWVHFSGSKAKDYIANLGLQDQGYLIAIGHHPKILADFDALFSVRDTGYRMNALIHASHTLSQSLTYLALLTPSQLQQARNPIDLESIQAYMTANLHRELELGELAQQAHLSKYHFSKRYKELTGYSPIQHFIHLKMERACYLLDITSKTISNLALELGYDDPHYFSRLFKKVTGLSPRDYRKLEKG
jgi:AraC family transcriptional regulator of arabinose operon